MRTIGEQALAGRTPLGLHTSSDGEEESNDRDDADHDDGRLKNFKRMGSCSGCSIKRMNLCGVSPTWRPLGLYTTLGLFTFSSSTSISSTAKSTKVSVLSLHCSNLTSLRITKLV